MEFGDKTGGQNFVKDVDMWVRRRMKIIICTDIVSNEEVPNRSKETRTLLDTIIKMKGHRIGHNLRGIRIPTIVLEGAVEQERR